jgi:hypothetical protein
LLDAVAVFPAEFGAEGWSEWLVVEVLGVLAAGWVAVFGADQAPGVPGCGGEAVEFPFRCPAGVLGGQAAVGAEEVFEGPVRASF